LHSFASSGRAMQALSGLDALAEQNGTLVAYPDAFDLDWDDGQSQTGWPVKLQFLDDVGFVSALIDHLSEEYTIDPERIYVAGFGAGGDMAFRLACVLPDRLAKVAVVGSLTWDYHVSMCGEPSEPVSLLVLNGANNLDRPAEGRTVTDDASGRSLNILNAEATASFWAARNECDLGAIRAAENPRRLIYDQCAGEASVSVYIFQGVGNNWPHTGDYILNQFGVDFSQMVMDFFAADTPPEFTEDAVLEVYGGAARSYFVYVPPSYDPAVPMPLVMALHGRPGTATGLAYLFDLNRVAHDEGFIVVYPDGTPVKGAGAGREWNYARGTPGYRDPGVDDVDLLSVLVDDLSLDLNIDQNRLYMTGFSNGGFMTQRLACDAGERWAAFASIGATLYPVLLDECAGKPPVPMMLIHGTQDVSVGWEGNNYLGNIISYSVPDTILFWAIHDNCDPETLDYSVIPTTLEAPTTQVFRYVFDDCAMGTELVYYVVEGGGHNIPGVADRLEVEIAGNVNMDIHAGEEIWKFFEHHALPHEG
ncbi:MAG: prolyl oligopeptidase family serine peptidase, partial [Chloroflexi bacterium]|nr:prolyl oligopeptidase family serine peptidase [Chloroflexota bacterium]